MAKADMTYVSRMDESFHTSMVLVSNISCKGGQRFRWLEIKKDLKGIADTDTDKDGRKAAMDRGSWPCLHEVLIRKWANDMEEDTITAVTGGAICQIQTCLCTQESCTLPGYAIYLDGHIQRFCKLNFHELRISIC